MPRTKRSRKKPKSRRRGFDEKMSAVLLDFIEPYQQYADTPEAMEKLVIMGITAWNVALLPENERSAMIPKLATAALKGGSPVRRLMSTIRTAILGQSREVADFKGIVNDLVKRKLQHYAENRRFILNYEFAQTADDVHLFVVSTLTPVP
jgi:hypothetical protein